jgi:choline dehydrogenase-like flavoprotein
VLGRPNLSLISDALVEKVRIEGGRATGVTVVRDGRRMELTAALEVVLAAGTVNSPQLLLLSGIGPAADLARHGIAVVRDLPGVGANLQDHPTASIAVANPSAESYALSLRALPRVAAAPFNYLLQRRGMLASNAAEAGGFLRSRPGLDRPDLQMTFMVGMKGSARTVPRAHGFVVHVAVLRPSARGRLELASADPAAKPVMHARFLQDAVDAETLVAGMKEARRILAMPALAAFSGAELSPGRAVASDAELESFVRATATTTYHPVGTCKMGPASDPMAVVDPQLRVHGVAGLRVADASIIPDIVGGNTSAPAMMIGERAAAFVLAPGAAAARQQQHALV